MMRLRLRIYAAMSFIATAAATSGLLPDIGMMGRDVFADIGAFTWPTAQARANTAHARGRGRIYEGGSTAAHDDRREFFRAPPADATGLGRHARRLPRGQLTGGLDAPRGRRRRKRVGEPIGK